MPAYTFPENREDLAALRIVVRNGFTRDLGRALLEDIERETARLQKEGRRPAGWTSERASTDEDRRG